MMILTSNVYTGSVFQIEKNPYQYVHLNMSMDSNILLSTFDLEGDECTIKLGDVYNSSKDAMSAVFKFIDTDVSSLKIVNKNDIIITEHVF